MISKVLRTSWEASEQLLSGKRKPMTMESLGKVCKISLRRKGLKTKGAAMSVSNVQETESRKAKEASTGIGLIGNDS